MHVVGKSFSSGRRRTQMTRSLTVDFELVLLLSRPCLVDSSAGVLAVVQRRQGSQNEKSAVLQNGHAGLVTRELLAVAQPADDWLWQAWKSEGCN